jgi:hypothetical protein
MVYPEPNPSSLEGEADAFWEETGVSTGRKGRGMGPSTYTRTMEITPGTTNFQQGLAATCKDPPTKGNRRRWEDFGGAHEPVASDEGRVMPAEMALDAIPKEVTPSSSEGALGKWRVPARRTVRILSRVAGSPAQYRARRITSHEGGVCERALKLRRVVGRSSWKSCCCQPDSGNPTVRDERGACGNVGDGQG